MDEPRAGGDPRRALRPSWRVSAYLLAGCSVLALQALSCHGLAVRRSPAALATPVLLFVALAMAWAATA